MNYIKLINAFYDRLETNPLSTSAIALWHALVHVNNKAGWQREFSVAASVLCVKTGLSERTISNARNDLKVKGYIDFKSRKGNKSAIYLLVDLSEMIANNVSYNLSDSSSDNVSTLNKQKETKPKQLNNDDERGKIMRFYEENGFGTIGTLIAEKIHYWCDDISPELVLEALKRTVMNGKTNFTYTETILQNWMSKKLKTLEDVNAEDLAYKQQKSKQRAYSGPKNRHTREELVPDWLHSNPENQNTSSQVDSAIEQQKIADLQQRLRQKYAK
ncbi:DnaD domain protein [Bacillus massiliigorillae]|uniref:DnaD domain protein n=1 Tax=Bacillus massiliigorillae TaxID=1243664 RepID=UPI0003A07EBB|nr:DnaD domain protein [Bacillus massiliigorillae]